MSASATLDSAAAVANSPYVGLAFYTEEDADVFFGRDPECEIVVGNLRASRLTILYAESGAGKSSLLRAGVAAKLRRLAIRNHAERGSPRHVPVVFATWRDDPIADLLEAVEQAIRPFMPAGSPTALPASSLEDALAAAAKATDATLLIVLDQFEEYLLYRSMRAGADPVADEIARCVNRRDLRANFLISMREDAYAGLGDLFRARLANVYGNTLHLEHLARDAAREAIEKPLDHFNATHPDELPVEIEPELIETVLSEVRSGQVVLERSALGMAVSDGRVDEDVGDSIETPYLQLVMTRLWERERSDGARTMRLSTLEQLGGSQTIVRTHLERALKGFDAGQRETATEVFLHLVTPSGAKIANSISDLASWSGRPEERVESLISKLAGSDQRIVRPLPPAPGSTSPRVEIYHDVLADAILAWCQSQTEARLRHERNAARRRVALVGALALLALAFGVFAFAQRQHAVKEAHLNLSNALAFQSNRLLLSDVSLASLLSLKSYALAPTDQARAAVNDALGLPLAAVLPGDSAVKSVAFSPGGEMLAAGDLAGGVVLWNLATHARVGRLRSDNGGAVFSVAFSPDGKRLAAGDFAGNVVLWNLTKHTQVGRLRSDNGSHVFSVAFSPDGGMLASGDQAGNVVLWNLAKLAPVGRPLSDGSPVNSVAFSPKGRLLASGDEEGNVVLWNPTKRTREGQLRSDGSPVKSVAFSPNGRLLASGDVGNNVVLWNLAKHTQEGQPLSHNSPVISVAISPNGETLASGTYEGKVVLWNLTTHAQEGKPLPDGSEVGSVVFSPRGDTVASADNAGDVLLWKLAPPARVGRLRSGNGSPVNSVAFSPNARLLASGDEEGNVVLWNLAKHTQEGQPLSDGSPVKSVAFSPNGRLLASGDEAGDVVLWNLTEHAQVGRLRYDGTSVESVAFSPNGKMLASGDEGGNVVLWNLTNHAREGRPLPVGSTVISVAFSPNGKTLASGDDAYKVVLWDLTNHAQVGRPLTHDSHVFTVAFSPDGKTLASGDYDGDVLLSDPVTGERTGRIHGNGTSVESVAFSPNGKRLAAGDGGGNVVLYSPLYGRGSFAQLRNTLCGELRTNLTRVQWSQYVPGESYEKLCPRYP